MKLVIDIIGNQIPIIELNIYEIEQFIIEQRGEQNKFIHLKRVDILQNP